MKKPVVVITDYVEENLSWEMEQLSRTADLRIYQERFAPPELLMTILRDARIVIVNMARISAEIIGKMNQCGLIIRHGIGYDNVDVKAAAAAGIPVVNIPDYCIDEVAEQTVMLMLAAARRLNEQMETVRSSVGDRGWQSAGIPRISRISGKTLGILGFGRVGRRVAELCSGFGLPILVYDPYIAPDSLPSGVKAVSLDKAAAESDFLCVTAILTPETRHMVDRRIFGLMKSEAFLINTSRGGVVDQEALAEALHTRLIAGAAADVYEGAEPPDRKNPLLNCPRIIMTPHYSWASVEAEADIRQKIVRLVKEFIKYGRLGNVVNMPARNPAVRQLPD
jgi:D-3-phosphoglycerate dehydrogenase